MEVERLTEIAYKNGYAKGVKEFAERLKDKAGESWDGAITEWEIDDVAEEMVSADNG